MAETTAERADAVQAVLRETQGDTPEVKEAALKAVIGPADQPTTNVLWIILVSGLVLIIFVSVLGLLFGDALEVDQDKMWAAGGAVLTGLIGLFAPSPVGNTENEGA